jgi:hypothetical protein
MGELLPEIPANYWAPYCIADGCASRGKMIRAGEDWICKECGHRVDENFKTIVKGKGERDAIKRPY